MITKLPRSEQFRPENYFLLRTRKKKLNQTLASTLQSDNPWILQHLQRTKTATNEEIVLDSAKISRIPSTRSPFISDLAPGRRRRVNRSSRVFADLRAQQRALASSHPLSYLALASIADCLYWPRFSGRRCRRNKKKSSVASSYSRGSRLDDLTCSGSRRIEGPLRDKERLEPMPPSLRRRQHLESRILFCSSVVSPFVDLRRLWLRLIGCRFAQFSPVLSRCLLAGDEGKFLGRRCCLWRERLRERWDLRFLVKLLALWKLFDWPLIIVTLCYVCRIGCRKSIMNTEELIFLIYYAIEFKTTPCLIYWSV